MVFSQLRRAFIMLSLGLLALKCWLGWINGIPHALWAFITGSGIDGSKDLPWKTVRIYSQSDTEIDAPSDRAVRHAVYRTLHVALVIIALTATMLTVMCVWACIYARRQRYRALGHLVGKPEHPGITAFTAQPDPALTRPATHGGKHRSGNAAVHTEIRSFKPSPAGPMPPQDGNEPLRHCAVPVSPEYPPPLNEEFSPIGTVATLSMLLDENERARAEIAMPREALVDPPPYSSTNRE